MIKNNRQVQEEENTDNWPFFDQFQSDKFGSCKWLIRLRSGIELIFDRGNFRTPTLINIANGPSSKFTTVALSAVEMCMEIDKE